MIIPHLRKVAVFHWHTTIKQKGKGQSNIHYIFDSFHFTFSDLFAWGEALRKFVHKIAPVANRQTHIMEHKTKKKNFHRPNHYWEECKQKAKMIFVYTMSSITSLQTFRNPLLCS